MYNLTSERDIEKIRAHEAAYGGYNDFPPGWREITPEEFAHSNFFVFSFIQTEYRQMVRKPDGTRSTMIAATLFFHARGCFAISRRNGMPVYFRFGCEHQWGSARDELQRLGRRLTAHERARFCSKCQTLEIDDSSD